MSMVAPAASIMEVEHNLTRSEGARQSLLQELRRQKMEQVELERQFNDLTLLKAAVSKLKSELAVARRIEFIRAGLFNNLRGADKLMTNLPLNLESGSATSNAPGSWSNSSILVPSNAATP